MPSKEEVEWWNRELCDCESEDGSVPGRGWKRSVGVGVRSVRGESSTPSSMTASGSVTTVNPRRVVGESGTEVLETLPKKLRVVDLRDEMRL